MLYGWYISIPTMHSCFTWHRKLLLVSLVAKKRKEARSQKHSNIHATKILKIWLGFYFRDKIVTHFINKVPNTD